MNLGTHVFFAGIVTAVFTGNPYFTLLAGIGSFIPDLDRVYLLVKPQTFRDEELHRALFHNLLFLSALFLINVWLATGAFLHSFLDSFTTEKDKGVEWLYPFTRLVKRGRYALAAIREKDDCNLELVDQKPGDRVCFINEDSPEMTKLSDPDLKKYRPVPWRRTYGPAANGQLFDRWLMLGTFSLFVAYAAINTNFTTEATALLMSTSFLPPMSLLSGIVLVYIGGWLKKQNYSRQLYLILSAMGVIFIALSAVASIGSFAAYRSPIDPLFVVVAAVVLFLEALLVWKLSTRGGKKVLV